VTVLDSIDRNSPIPIYYQLKLLIQEQIKRGEWRPGDKVPTEAELCERYEISRTPVRQALLELVREGVLTRRAGRGTFVAPRPETFTTLRVILSDSRWQWPLEEALHLWNREHPDDRLELDCEIVALPRLYDRLTLSVAQGRAPDISLLDSVWVAEFAHRRYLLSPEEVDSAWADRVKRGLYPPVLTANSYQNTLYTIPTNADTTVLWYRRDWFAAEGLKPPQTWSELIEVGRHLRGARVRARYGMGAYPLAFVGGRAGGETTTYQLLPFLWSFGADIIEEGQVVLGRPTTVEALTFLKRLLQKEKLASPGAIAYRWDSAVKAFGRGEVAMALGGTYENYMIRAIAGWDMPAFLEHVGFSLLPAGPQGAPATLVGGMTYGIYRQSAHPQKALALLERMITPEILSTFSRNTGHNSAYVSVAEAIRREDDGFLSQTAPLVAHARSRPSSPVYQRISSHFQEMIEFALTGERSCKEAARRAAERIGGATGLPVI